MSSVVGVTSFISAGLPLNPPGLVIDAFKEDPYGAWCPWPELMAADDARGYRPRERPERLPLQFVIEAHCPSKAQTL